MIEFLKNDPISKSKIEKLNAEAVENIKSLALERKKSFFMLFVLGLFCLLTVGVLTYGYLFTALSEIVNIDYNRKDMALMSFVLIMICALIIYDKSDNYLKKIDEKIADEEKMIEITEQLPKEFCEEMTTFVKDEELAAYHNKVIAMGRAYCVGEFMAMRVFFEEKKKKKACNDLYFPVEMSVA